MDATLRKSAVFSGLVILVILAAVTFWYKEYPNLLGSKTEHFSLKTQNSQKGLELFNQIDLLKRLADNDLKLIEHIAGRELGLVRKGELIFVYEPAEGSKNSEIQTTGFTPVFRFLTEEEFDLLLKFDLKAFDFYEEISEFEKQAHPSSFNLND